MPSWNVPFTAVPGTLIKSSDWNTSGRDDIQYLFNILNKVQAQTDGINIQQDADLLAHGFQTWTSVPGHYASLVAIGATAVLGNDSNKYISVDGLGNVSASGAPMWPWSIGHFSATISVTANTLFVVAQATGLEGGTYLVLANVGSFRASGGSYTGQWFVNGGLLAAAGALTRTDNIPATSTEDSQVVVDVVQSTTTISIMFNVLADGNLPGQAAHADVIIVRIA